VNLDGICATGVPEKYAEKQCAVQMQFSVGIAGQAAKSRSDVSSGILTIPAGRTGIAGPICPAFIPHPKIFFEN
jgi:hypothetical protein